MPCSAYNMPYSNGISPQVGLIERRSRRDEDETLVDMFRKVASDPRTRNNIVLCDPVERSDIIDAKVTFSLGRQEWTLGQLDTLTESLATIFVSQRFKCPR